MENTYSSPNGTEAILPPSYYPLPPRRPSRSRRTRQTDGASSRPPPQYAFMEDDAFDRRVPTPPPRPRTPRPRRHSDGEGYYGRVTTTDDDDDDEISAETQANLETLYRLARMGRNAVSGSHYICSDRTSLSLKLNLVTTPNIAAICKFSSRDP